MLTRFEPLGLVETVWEIQIPDTMMLGIKITQMFNLGKDSPCAPSSLTNPGSKGVAGSTTDPRLTPGEWGGAGSRGLQEPNYPRNVLVLKRNTSNDPPQLNMVHGAGEIFQNRTRAYHEQVMVYHDRMRTYEDRVRAYYDRLKTYQNELKADHDQPAAFPSKLETLQEAAPDFEQIRAYHGQLDVFHNQLKTYHEELRLYHDQLKAFQAQAQEEAGSSHAATDEDQEIYPRGIPVRADDESDPEGPISTDNGSEIVIKKRGAAGVLGSDAEASGRRVTTVVRHEKSHGGG